MDFYYQREVSQPDDQIHLAKAALYFARAEYPDLQPDPYLFQLREMAATLASRLPSPRYPLKVIEAINQYLFQELGYSGNSRNYYDPRNSFLNEVLTRRTGIPISLAVVYLELAKLLDFPMVGIGLPGHFLVRPDFEEVGIFVDVFNEGEILFAEDCEQRLQQVYQQEIRLQPHFLEPVGNRQILARMLTNLKFIYINSHDYERALTIVSFLLATLPHATTELRDRGLLYYQTGQFAAAVLDLEAYLSLAPQAQDASTIHQILEQIR